MMKKRKQFNNHEEYLEAKDMSTDEPLQDFIETCPNGCTNGVLDVQDGGVREVFKRIVFGLRS